MTDTTRHLALAAALIAAPLLFPATASAQRAEDASVQSPGYEDDGYGDEYRSGDFGRVLFQENGMTVRRADPDVDSGSSEEPESRYNVPIFPGDAVLTGFDQRVEVQLSGGTLVRIDRLSEVAFQSLPSPDLTIADNSILGLVEGKLRISSRLGDDEDFRIDTPAASVYLISDGDFRVEVDETGRTTIVSRRGIAEAVSEGRSLLVRGGTRLELRPGSFDTAVARPFNTFSSDGFDRWVEQRDDYSRNADAYAGSTEAYRELPQEVQPYYRELSGHGRWAYEADYGYVWVPRVSAPDWRPYRDGYWSYGPRGYFWVSNEPWGWAPYHYGRWAHVSGNWAWIPGRVFGGAWVAWSWGSAYVGWTPLDYWSRPLCVGSVYYGYYDTRAWTFLHHRHLNHRYYPRYAVSVHDVGDGIHGHAVVTRPPRERPRDVASSAEVRRRAVRHAQNDRSARVEPLSKTARNGRGLREVETGITANRSSATDRSRTQASRSRAGARRVQTGAAASTPPTGSRTGRDRTARPPQADPERNRIPSAGRRQPTRDGAAGREGTAPGAIRRDPPSRSQPAARPDVPRKQQVGSRDGTSERRRDLYQKMARPRTTRERSDATKPRTPAPARPKPTAGRVPTSRQPKATPNPAPRKPPARAPSRPPARRPTKADRDDGRRSGTVARTPSRAPSRSTSVARPPRSNPTPQARSGAPKRTPSVRPSTPTRRPTVKPRAPARRPSARPSSPPRRPSARPSAPKRAPKRAPAKRGSSRSGAKKR